MIRGDNHDFLPKNDKGDNYDFYLTLIAIQQSLFYTFLMYLSLVLNTSAELKIQMVI